MNRIKIACIYKISNPAGKVYIGQTVDFYMRMSKHKNSKTNSRLSRSISKFGWDAHTVDKIQILPNDVDIDILNIYEVLYIELYSACGIELLNLTSGGKNFRMSEESKKKISIAVKNMSDETRMKRRIGKLGNKNNLGNTASIETRQKMSNASKGNQYGLGHILSDEHKEKIKQAHLGVARSIETKRKISEGLKGNKIWLGRKHTEETKRKLSLSKEFISEETRLKLSKIHKGKIISDQTRINMSLAQKKRFANAKSIVI